MELFIQIRLLMFILLWITLHLNANIRDKKLYDKVLGVIVIIYLIQNTLIFPVHFASAYGDYGYIDKAAPFSLIYCPMLYFYYRAVLYNKLNIISIIGHSIPVLLFWIAYFFFIADANFRLKFSHWYYIMEYGAISASLLSYSLFILYKIRQHRILLMERIKFFALFCAFSGCFTTFITFSLIFKTNTERNSSSVANAIMVAIFMMVGAVILLTEAFRHFKGQYYPKEKPDHPASSTNIHKKIYNKFTFVIKRQSFETFFNSEQILNPVMDLKKAARILNISQKELQLYIHQYYHCSFQKILMIKRIEAACYLLTDENFDGEYDALAARCGFKSQATFYRNFRGLKGYSPSKYRENYTGLIQ